MITHRTLMGLMGIDCTTMKRFDAITGIIPLQRYIMKKQTWMIVCLAVFWGCCAVKIQPADAQEPAKDTIIETDITKNGLETAKTIHLLPKPKEWQIQGALAALQDAIPEVQVEALRKLDELHVLERIPATYVPQLAALLKHPNFGVRRIAIDILGKLGAAGQPYIPQLAELLAQGEWDIRFAAAQALSQLDASGKSYIPPILALLKNQDWTVRSNAATLLGKLGENAKGVLPPLIELLTDKDWEVRAAAAAALGNMGAMAKAAVPQITGLLNDSDWEIRAAAAKALGNLGAVAGNSIPNIALLLKDESWSVRASAARALGNMSHAAQPYLPQIAELLHDANEHVRAAAAWSLGNLGEESLTYLSEITAHFHDANGIVRAAAVEAIGKMGEAGTPYLAQMTAMITDSDWEVRSAAARALESLGGSTKTAASQISSLLQDKDWYVRATSARVLGHLGSVAAAFLPQIAALLKDQNSDVRSAALWALGDLGEESQAFRSQIIPLLEDWHSGVQYAAFRALGNLGKVDLSPIPALLHPMYADASRSAELRFLSHLVGAGDEDVERLLRWVGSPERNQPNLQDLSYLDAKKTLATFDAVWQPAVSFQKIASDMANQIAAIVTQMKAQWQYGDLAILQQQLQHLERIQSPHVETVKGVIALVERKHTQRVAGLILLACLSHPAFWMFLLLLYPFSHHIRAWFCWNSAVRRILGLGYIGVMLTRIPFLRRYLFLPFRKHLLLDAAVKEWDASTYFSEREVIQTGVHNCRPAHQAIRNISGKMIVEGESGAGKTMFCRALLQRARISVYLPAQSCSIGVLEAIQSKLGGIGARDPAFFGTLMTRGAIDVCIDGMNEASDATRTKIARYFHSNLTKNVMLVTRPIDWSPPVEAKIYVLQPLRQDQIAPFLRSCYTLLPEQAAISRSDYDQACQEYLADVLNSEQPSEASETVQRALSNPMTLTLIAILGAYGQNPELSNLPEQSYRTMAAEYAKMYPGGAFPLTQFAAQVSRMRHFDERAIPAEFANEIACMERFRMVVKRPTLASDGQVIPSWMFRHETILECFAKFAQQEIVRK